MCKETYSRVTATAQDVQFSENDAPTLLADNRNATETGQFYGGCQDPLVCTYEGPEADTEIPPCSNDPVVPLIEASSEGFLEPTGDWIEQDEDVWVSAMKQGLLSTIQWPGCVLRCRQGKPLYFA